MSRKKDREKHRQEVYNWLRKTGHLPCLEKPRGEIPQHAINHFRMPVYGLDRRADGSDSEKG